MRSYISPLSSPLLAGNVRDDAPRSLVVLGSTGSIGVSALDVAGANPERFTVVALAGARNVARLAEQAARFRPPYLGVLDAAGAAELVERLRPLRDEYRPQVTVGAEGYAALAALPEGDVVLSAIVGAAGLGPTMAAVRAGKVVALANKESLVLAGGLIRAECRKSGAVILPVDSEHNALFQSMLGHCGLRSGGDEYGRSVDALILTASGGPFRGRDRASLAGVTANQALNHPTWSMGAKISIDSATLMNKGLEFIEAHHLFGLPPEKIEVVVHPQSIVHSLVRYVDGSLLAQLGPPDMRIAIAYCLAFPERLALPTPPLDLAALRTLEFEPPDLKAFPCLALAIESLRGGPGRPVVLNAANEVAVELFLQDAIGFTDISEIIALCLEDYQARGEWGVPDLESVQALDAFSQTRAREIAAGLAGFRGVRAHTSAATA